MISSSLLLRSCLFATENSFLSILWRHRIVSGTRVELQWIYCSAWTLLFITKEKTDLLNLSCLTFQIFSLASFLAVAKVLTYIFALAFSNRLLVKNNVYVFSFLGENGTWKYNVKKSVWCFSNGNRVNSVLYDPKENANFSGDEVIFSALINYFRKLLEFFGGLLSDMY